MIQSLRLNNFKCFADQTIHFAPLTVLSGLNGQGKSSVLQALLLLRQSYQQGLLPEKGLALNGDWVRIGTAKDAFYDNAEDDTIGFDLKLNNGKDDKKGEWIFAYHPEAEVLNLKSKPLSSDFFRNSLFDDNFQYVQAERLGPRVSSEKSDFYVRQHRHLGTRGEYCVDFLATFGRRIKSLKGLIHPQSISEDFSDQTEAWLNEITPGIRLNFMSHPGTDSISIRYAFETGRGVSSDYRSTNVGFGLSYTLPILIAMLSASKGSLLLFENPEAHLHPKGQAKLGELMARAANCGVQIVAETHSDHILNGIRVAVHAGILPPEEVQLHFFERKADNLYSEVISPQMDLNGRIDQWPEGFFDEWDKALEALLTPRED